MREIKYRFWHKKSEYFVTWEVARKLFEGFEITVGKKIPTDMRSVDYILYKENDSYWRYKNINIFDHPDFIPSQFIGEQDKSGRDIYEGDICTDGKGVHDIKWQHNKWQFWIEDCVGCYAERLLVVGNIYQNRELLK